MRWTSKSAGTAASMRARNSLNSAARWAHKLTVHNADLNLVTCYLPRGRSFGTDAVVEVSQ
jgi:hypothetical protein